MGKRLHAGAAALAIMAASPTFAQSLEASYAKQCDTPARKATEMCQVMAQALVAKLQGEAAAGPAKPVAKPAAPARDAAPSPAELRRRWGFLIDFIGKPMFAIDGQAGTADTGSRYVLEWDVPGVTLLRRRLSGDGAETVAFSYRWNADEERVERAVPALGIVLGYTVGPDGNLTSVVQAATGVVREKWERFESAYRISSETNEGRGWVLGNDVTFLPPTPEIMGDVTRLTALYAQMYRNRQQTAEVKAAMQGGRSDEEFEQYIAELTRRNAEREAEKRRRAEERSDRFLQVMGAVNAGLTAANEVASANEATSRAALDATLAQVGRDTGASASAPLPVTTTVATAPRTADVPSSPTAARPLRFVLSIGLMNKPGDTVNPTCYSNVVTRPGPPGWGAGGFLPAGSMAQARAKVDSLKAQFLASCRASGREITSEGNFHWTWNETRDGDRQVADTHARYPEDVTVAL